jgi:uncharacterized membrane protein
MYLIFYSVGGFVLERIINIFFYGEWFDNSVLIGPYQPLYGSGILLTIIFYDIFSKKLNKIKVIYKDIGLIVAAIFFTGLVEAITGYGFEFLFGVHLWNYGDFFPCSLEYICIFTTPIFGIISYLVVRYLHPLFKRHLSGVNNYLYYSILLIFIADVVITLIKLSN